MASWAQKTGKTGSESRPGTAGSASGILVVEENADESGLVRNQASVTRPNSLRKTDDDGKRASPREDSQQCSRSQSKNLEVPPEQPRPGRKTSIESRSGGTRSRVSFAALSLGKGDKQPLTKDDAKDAEEEEAAKEERRKKKEKRKEKCNFFIKWTKLTLYLLILVGVVSLCVISAILSFLKFIKTSGQPASTYKPLKNPGPHEIPGIIFIGVGLDLHRCGVLNFTSLDIDNIARDEICDTLFFDLKPSDSLSASALESLPDFLKKEKAQDHVVSVFLFRGPAMWENKETTSVHFLIPGSTAGTWAVIHQFHEEAFGMFEGAIAGDAEDRWLLAARVVIEYSLTFVAADYRSFFLMRKQEFKKSGTIETTRIDMEISLVEFNRTQFHSLYPGTMSEKHHKSHVEALFQWKDGYYMEGDTFLATSPFQIVTVISSALLMFDRAYNTFMRLIASAKQKPKAAKRDDEDKEKEKTENEEPEEVEDGKRSAFDNPFASEIIESDQEFQDDDFGQQKNQNDNEDFD